MLNYFLNPIKNDYANFKGRTGRKAFWMYILVYFILSIIAGVIDGIIGIQIIGTIVSLALILPSISISARRMHDVGKSGWFSIIPFYNIYLLIQPSEEGTNKWGAQPTDN